jgi:hypothetical protein
MTKGKKSHPMLPADAGRRGRGPNALQSKKDPDLQKRIDQVVEKALIAEQSAPT